MSRLKKNRKKVKSPAYDVVGITNDGVKILRGVTKPTHFTSEQIRATIMEIKQKSLNGPDRAEYDAANI